MTLTMPEIGLEILEDLDFDAELPCEHREHDDHPAHEGPGAYLVRVSSHCGDSTPSLVICKKAWEWAAVVGLRCSTCRIIRPRAEAWRIIGSVK